MDGVGQPVILPAVAVHVAALAVVCFLVILLVSQFLECAINLCNFAGQGDDLFLVGVWACPGAILDHVGVLALGHLHELLRGEVFSSVINIIVVADA